jgi:hypothetical protein
MMRAIQERVDKAVAVKQKSGDTRGEEALREEMQEYYADLMETASPRATPATLVERFAAINPTSYFSPLIALALCFIPIAILVLTKFESVGSFSMVLQRDYSSLLLCALLAWTASHLLLLLVNSVLWAMHSPAHNHPALWWGAHAYFLVLTALAMRTIAGGKLTSALAAIGGGWVGAIAGIGLYAVVGNPLAYVASPCLLYYLYCNISPGVASIGGGLRARQRLKACLETATLNPADSDAHYQLGLIYAQRRQYDSAVECYRKAVEIAPKEPDAHHQLGRIAREQGRYAEALEHCRTAARLDDKHSSSEVWREIGIASFLDGDFKTARQAMEKYLDRRPYDPEGLCWYGRLLARLEDTDAARAAFEQAIEAVRTMPAQRKRQLRGWESESARELKKLPARREAALASNR